MVPDPDSRACAARSPKTPELEDLLSSMAQINFDPELSPALKLGATTGISPKPSPTPPSIGSSTTPTVITASDSIHLTQAHARQRGDAIAN